MNEDLWHVQQMRRTKVDQAIEILKLGYTCLDCTSQSTADQALLALRGDVIKFLKEEFSVKSDTGTKKL